MAPKNKITREEIINTALLLVEERGKDELNARSLATALGTSTQPIFSNFGNMKEVKAEVVKKAIEMYLELIKETEASGLYPAYKASGMAYIRYAKEKSELFKLVFMDSGGKHNIDAYYDIISAMAESIGISFEEASKLHVRMWIFVHGIATMLATEYIEFNYDDASSMITDVYNGLIAKYKRKENG